MVPKISPSRASARSCFEYDIRPKNGQPRGDWIAGTLQGTPRQMAQMAGAYRALRPDCKKPVWRCSLSLPPSDGRPTHEKWADIAHDFLKEMGIPKDAAWCAVYHGDVAHAHIHITLLRTLPNGRLWSGERSAKHAIKVCAVLEARYQLASHDRTPKPTDQSSRAEKEIFNRQQKKGNQPMSREYIQKAVDTILDDYPPPKGIAFIDLQELLSQLNPPIDLQASMPKGVFRGVSYQLDSFKWPGSKIGREYSVGLVERGVRMPSAESHSAKQTPVSSLTTLAEPVLPALERQRVDQRRIPEMLRPHLQKQQSAKQLRSLGTRVLQANDEPELFKSIRAAQPLTRYATLYKTLAILAIETIKFSASIAKAVWDFIKAILALFGLGLRAPALQNYEQPEPEQLAYEPYKLENAAPAQLAHDDVDEAAAAAVMQVVDALKNGTPEALPAAPGRDELIKKLKEESSKTASGAAAIDPMAGIFSGPETEIAPPVKPEPDPIFSLDKSAAEYISTFEKVRAARLPIALIGGLDFTDGMASAVEEARRELKEAQDAHEYYQKIHPIASRVWATAEKIRLEKAQENVKHKTGVLENHKADLAKWKKANSLQPARLPPQALLNLQESHRAAFLADKDRLRDALKAILASVQDARLKVTLEKQIADVAGSLSRAEREGSAGALAAALEGAREVRRQAEAEQMRLSTPRPIDERVSSHEPGESDA